MSYCSYSTHHQIYTHHSSIYCIVLLSLRGRCHGSGGHLFHSVLFPEPETVPGMLVFNKCVLNKSVNKYFRLSWKQTVSRASKTRASSVKAKNTRCYFGEPSADHQHQLHFGSHVSYLWPLSLQPSLGVKRKKWWLTERCWKIGPFIQSSGGTVINPRGWWKLKLTLKCSGGSQMKAAALLSNGNSQKQSTKDCEPSSH